MPKARSLLVLVLVAVAIAALPLSSVAGAPRADSSGMARAIAAQERHSDALLARGDVTATGVGFDDTGRWSVVLYTSRPGAAGLPAVLDHVPVTVRYSGVVRALQGPATVASFTYSCAGLVCSFDASSSTTRGQATFAWSFGDGSTGSGITVNHSFAAAGTYNVALTVNSKGGQDTEAKAVSVSESGGGGGGSGCDSAGVTQIRCDRPAPLGVSVGHPAITAGTIGARVRDTSGNVYILSNNHVLANGNVANIGDAALQPGPYDGGTAPNDVLGTLADFQPIVFSSSASNQMDAAIAATTEAELGNATPAGVYGMPSASPQTATLGMPVQKYGRTTGHTHGYVEAVNVTVTVCYAGVMVCTQAARFTNQVAIAGTNYSAGGDSGSLIVTDDANRNPVALLFAGSSTTTFANPIQPVLDRFGVTVDGWSAGSPPAAVIAAPSSATEDVAAAFDASGSSDPDSSTLTYAWDFGDGSVGTGVSPSHTYLWGGDFTVTVTVSDGNGNTDSDSAIVSVAEVNDAPVAVAGGPYSGYIDQAIQFDGSGTSDYDNADGTIANDQALFYSWEFGDSGTGSLVQPSHAYAAADDYTVVLLVSDGIASSSDSATASVTAAPPGVSISGVSPSTIPSGPTTVVTILGGGFQPGATVSISGGEGPAPTVGTVTYVDAGTLQVPVTPKSGGPPRLRYWTVTVTNPGGASGQLVGGLTVTP